MVARTLKECGERIVLCTRDASPRHWEVKSVNDTQRGSNGWCCRNGELHLNVHARVESYGSSPGYTKILAPALASIGGSLQWKCRTAGIGRRVRTTGRRSTSSEPCTIQHMKQHQLMVEGINDINVHGNTLRWPRIECASITACSSITTQKRRVL
jgi:hypothetical protein